MKPEDVQAISAAIGLPLLLIAPFSLVKQLYYLHLAIRTLSWSTAHGHLMEVSDRPLMLTQQRRRFRVPNPTVATVRYHYAVAGVEYESGTIGYHGVWRGTRAEHARIHRKYGRRGDVTVWYDPRTPARAVLEPGPGSSSYIRVGISMTMLMFGGILLRFALQSV